MKTQRREHTPSQLNNHVLILQLCAIYAMLYTCLMETPSSGMRLRAFNLGQLTTIHIVPSEWLAATALLPAGDGGLLGPEFAEALRDVADWPIMRALLVHGLALRDFVAERVLHGRSDVPPPVTFDDWVTWWPKHGETVWQQLLAMGAASGLHYYQVEMAPVDVVEAILARWSSREPTASELLANPSWLDEAVWAQAATWEVAESQVIPLLHDWRRAGRCLEQALRSVRRWTPPIRTVPMPFIQDTDTVVRAIEKISGRLVSEELRAVAESMNELTVVPTPGLAEHVITHSIGDDWMVWLEPATVASPSQSALESVPTVLAACADPVNFRIIELLRARASLRAQQMSEALHLHPSTVSRHVRDLLEAGLVEPERADTHVEYRLNPAGLDPLHEWLKTFRN